MSYGMNSVSSGKRQTGCSLEPWSLGLPPRRLKFHCQAPFWASCAGWTGRGLGLAHALRSPAGQRRAGRASSCGSMSLPHTRPQFQVPSRSGHRPAPRQPHHQPQGAQPHHARGERRLLCQPATCGCTPAQQWWAGGCARGEGPTPLQLSPKFPQDAKSIGYPHQPTFSEHKPCARHPPSIPFNPPSCPMWGCYSYSHFTDESGEAQRGLVTCWVTQLCK